MGWSGNRAEQLRARGALRGVELKQALAKQEDTNGLIQAIADNWMASLRERDDSRRAVKGHYRVSEEF